MGCNCKAKRDFNTFRKYSEEQVSGSDFTPSVDMGNWFERIIYSLFKLVGSVIVFALFLVVAVPLLIYVGVCMALGMPAKVVLKNPYKFFKKDKEDSDGKQ